MNSHETAQPRLQNATHSQADPRQRLGAAESEITAYRIENYRLARELDVMRETLAILLGRKSPAITETRHGTVVRLPRSEVDGDDIFLDVDICKLSGKSLEIAGWAFCPRIDCVEAFVFLWLVHESEQLLLSTRRMKRSDVLNHFEKAELSPHLPLAHPFRRTLDRSGFTCSTNLDGFPTGNRAYRLDIQIDGPLFSVRRATGVVVNG